MESANSSSYSDHHRERNAFSNVTSTTLDGYNDEVWVIGWSHDGRYLASGSKDKTAIIWKAGPESESSTRHWSKIHLLREHQYPVGCISWSLDDSILLTSSHNHIRVWNTKTGKCITVLEEHTEAVTALVWLSDGSGFISGGLDRRIILWDQHGKERDTWELAPIRITDLAVTPDMMSLIAIGMPRASPDQSIPSEQLSTPVEGGVSTSGDSPGHSLVVYDFATRQLESNVSFDGEVTSITVSHDSRYALINHASDDIYLWDIHLGRIARKFTGKKQGRHVIRSCFGGVNGIFVISGSEDGNVYAWNRDTGTLLEALSGHGEGSVSSVAWNPRNERVFASCSDDHTVRIWELPPLE